MFLVSVVVSSIFFMFRSHLRFIHSVKEYIDIGITRSLADQRTGRHRVPGAWEEDCSRDDVGQCFVEVRGGGNVPPSVIGLTLIVRYVSRNTARVAAMRFVQIFCKLSLEELGDGRMVTQGHD